MMKKVEDVVRGDTGRLDGSVHGIGVRDVCCMREGRRGLCRGRRSASIGVSRTKSDHTNEEIGNPNSLIGRWRGEDTW